MVRRTTADSRFSARLKELREQRGLSYRNLARLVPCSHVYVWELEHGGAAPSQKVAARLDDALAAGGELAAAAAAVFQAAGASARRPSGQGTSNGSSGKEAADELRERLLNAAAVDRRAIALLAAQANDIREVDRSLGARAAGAQMRGHLEALDQLRSFTMSADQREPLADLYAAAAALAGWQNLDLGNLKASWHHHEVAKSAAREGSSPAVLAHSTAQQAYVLVELGEQTSAIELAERSIAIAGTGVSPLLLSWLWAVQGELYAESGDTVAYHRAFEAAGRLLPADTHDPELPYVFLDDVHLARWRGSALARLGDVAATDELRYALDGLDASFTRARSGLHVDLAHALVAARRYNEARVELREAETLAARVASARQHRRIRRIESRLQAA
jgi:transcriptional regulator with XRE-family HTH domain